MIRGDNYDSLIFDMDGTLWSASSATAQGWNRALEKLGIDRRLTANEIESVTGKPYEACVEMLLPGLLETHPTALVTLEEQETLSVGKLGGELYADVALGMQALSDKYKIFIVSNCQTWYLELFFTTSKLKPLLTGFDCYGLSGDTKDAMLQSMKTSYALADSVYIGDTVWDEEAAGKAGMTFMHVTYGFGEAKNPAQRFSSFAELTDFFLRK